VAAKTVFVSGVSGIVGYGIVNSLKLSRHKIRVIGSCLDDYNYGSFQVDQNFIAPLTSSPDYMFWLERLIVNEQISLAIPGIEIDVHFWNRNKSTIQSAGCTPLLNASNLIDITYDKYRFYKDVEPRNFIHTIPTSDSRNYHEVTEFLETKNVIAKPKVGFAKKGFKRISTEFEFVSHLEASQTENIFQPNLESDGFEYTTGIFGNGIGGYSARITLRRRLAVAGYTEYAEVVDEPLIDEIIGEYCHLYNPIGPTNFQFMKTASRFYLLEINPRFSSSNSIRTLLGFNEAEMLLDFALEGILPEQPKLHYAKVVRFISDVIVQ
jgi:carbamoyl-phosphate synthase large subunit